MVPTIERTIEIVSITYIEALLSRGMSLPKSFK